MTIGLTSQIPRSLEQTVHLRLFDELSCSIPPTHRGSKISGGIEWWQEGLFTFDHKLMESENWL
jgi:hypothetical protein